MVPKIAKSGRSFKGATLYYLHDKNAATTERVAFVETVNLPTNDAQRATAHMIDTAAHANELKAAAGIKGGRKLQKPVYCYSLAWHPSETPTHAEQIEAARETMQLLGLSDHQALIVGHTDKDHLHVHVIVNRVHPEVGRAANMGNDQLKLSEWAEAYEKARGQVFCPEREKNNAARADRFVKDDSPSRQQNQLWKKAQTGKLWDEYHAARKVGDDELRSKLDALWWKRGERVASVLMANKGAYKPLWHGLFKKQADELAEHDNSFSARLKLALSHKGSSRVLAFGRALFRSGGLRDELLAQHSVARSELRRKQQSQLAAQVDEIDRAWEEDKQRLVDLYHESQAEKLSQTKDDVDQLWKQQGEKSGQAEVKAGGAFKEAARDKADDQDNQKEVLRKRLRRQRSRPRHRGR